MRNIKMSELPLMGTDRPNKYCTVHIRYISYLPMFTFASLTIQ